MQGGLKTTLSENHNIITCRHGMPRYIDTTVIYTIGKTKGCLAIVVLSRVYVLFYIMLATNR